VQVQGWLHKHVGDKLIDHSIATQIADAMQSATNAVLEDVRIGDMGDEDDFSSQLCASLKRTLNGKTYFSDPGESKDPIAHELPIRLQARHLTWRGSTGEEKKFGADIVLVLDIALPDYKTTKGLLIQTKHLEKGQSFSATEFNRLHRQCQDMLLITPASFVLVYSDAGIAAYSATALNSSQRPDPTIIPTYDLHWLYHDFAICWLGDVRLRATDRKSLLRVMDQYAIPDGLLVKASKAEVREESRG